MDVTNTFGEKLVHLRKGAEMSRSQLSERSNLSYPYISQLETGQRNPSRKSVWALSAALNVDPSTLEAAVPVDEPTSGEVLSVALCALPVDSKSVLADGLESGEGSRSASRRVDLVGDILDLLDEFEPAERIEALAEVQKRAMQRMIGDSSRKGRR